MPLDLNKLLTDMVQKQSSDLYLKLDSEPKIRVNGSLETVVPGKLQAADLKAAVAAVATPGQIAKLQLEKELNLAYRDSHGERFRVNLYQERGGTGIVFRHVKLLIPTVESLGVPIKLKEIALGQRGFFVICGPTGSGKSTTLAAMLDYRNQSRAGHIITIEDPIEFLYQDKQSIVSQREVGLDTLSFQNALKNALRQAPDVISIGEVRDLDTAVTALTMAETGHLVFATIHASNTYQSLERLIAIFTPEREKQLLMMLSMNLVGILSQRLIPRLDGEGRVAATELLIVTARVKELIHANLLSDMREVLRRSAEDGGHSFDQSIFELYQQGLISKVSALDFSDSPGEIKMQMQGFQGAIKQV